VKYVNKTNKNVDV